MTSLSSYGTADIPGNILVNLCWILLTFCYPLHSEAPKDCIPGVVVGLPTICINPSECLASTFVHCLYSQICEKGSSFGFGFGAQHTHSYSDEAIGVKCGDCFTPNFTPSVYEAICRP